MDRFLVAVAATDAAGHIVNDSATMIQIMGILPRLDPPVLDADDSGTFATTVREPLTKGVVVTAHSSAFSCSTAATRRFVRVRSRAPFRGGRSPR
ncbi:MAG TPA: hypothetical protein VLV78_08400 [Thermoanaerobaculia bacterium]|nr:hypothetical protein [Thermoanaerobaculia bacterium]